MAVSRTREHRMLDKAELELVSKSRHPELQGIPDRELTSLIGLLRERRDRASSEVRRRRREISGKAAPKGATAATSADGNKGKLEVLAAAVARLNAERTRRRRMADKVSQATLSRRARSLFEDGRLTDGRPENSRHAHDGLREIQSDARERLLRPAERGRQRKAGAVAQARKDSR